MTQRRKVLATIGAVILSLFVVWATRWRLVDIAGLCRNSDIRVIPSTDGRYNALVYTRDCGATTGWSTNVSIEGSHTKRAYGPGNVFRAEWEANADLPPTFSSGPAVQATWSGPTELRIVYDERSDPYLRNASARGVSVQYDSAVLPVRVRTDHAR